LAKKNQCVARVLVYPRQEILDPQGKAIGDALARLGFDQVSQVRAGKTFVIVLEGLNENQAEAMVQEMCAKLLANRVVEDYAIEMIDPGGGA
jgi:phosphoribosylformylglycinamidine synthase